MATLDANESDSPFSHPNANKSLGDSSIFSSDTVLHVSDSSQVSQDNMLNGGNETNTFSMGTDLIGMAERARELGLEKRAKLLIEEDESRVWEFSRVLDRILISSGDRMSVKLLKRLGRADSDIDDDDEDDEADKQLNLSETIAAIVKATVGSAVLYVPNGYAISGYLFAPPMLAIAYILVAWSSYNLLVVWKEQRMSFASLMGKAIGPKGEKLVQFMIVCLQCGICLTYFIFAAKNVISVASYFGFEVSLALLCVIQLVIYVPMTFIRNIQRFAIFNFLANLLIFSSLVTLSAYAVYDINTTPVHQDLLSFNEIGAAQFIGTCMFIFEGVMALCIPIQEAVEPNLVAEFPKIFISVLGAIMGSYIVFGYLNFYAYGEGTQMVLTENLPDGLLKFLIQIAFAFAIILTFPLQLFPAIGVLENLVTPKKAPLAQTQADYQSVQKSESEQPPVKDVSLWKGNIGRTCLVLSLCYTAVVNVDKLDKVVSLLGCLFGIPLGCIFPSFIHYRLASDQPSWVRQVNVAVVVLGTTLAVVLTLNVIATW